MEETTMATRREFVQALPAVGTAFAVGGHLVLDDSPARAQGVAAPLAGHFHPKGKAPSKYTLDILKQARGGLPFGDTRDLEEQKKGLIAGFRRRQPVAKAAFAFRRSGHGSTHGEACRIWWT
jgi:hypothetical protein